MRPPLTPTEALAARYERHPGRLLELARATGNKTLAVIALEMLSQARPKRDRSTAAQFRQHR
jgi:hypothetical protein